MSAVIHSVVIVGAGPTGLTLAITSVWGILELFSPEIPHMPVFFVFPMWCVGLAIGQLVNRFGFGDAGDCG